MDRKRWLARVKGGCAMCPVWGGKKRLLCAFILLQPSCPPRTTAKSSICSHPAGEHVFFLAHSSKETLLRKMPTVLCTYMVLLVVTGRVF